MQVLQYEVVLRSVFCKSIVVQTSTGKYSLAKSCTMKSYCEVLCANLVVQSICLAQALVLGSTLRKSCSAGKYFVQPLQYEEVLESTLCKLCSTK